MYFYVNEKKPQNMESVDYREKDASILLRNRYPFRLSCLEKGRIGHN